MGAKGRFAPWLMPVLRRMAAGATRYIEPFVGSAAIGLRMASDFPSMRHCWNDADPAIIALWTAVRDEADELGAQARAFIPSVEAFRAFKSSPPDGFQTLALAYMYWSGNGSGCRGGYSQQYERIGERWNADAIAQKIELASRRLRRVGIELRCEDFATAQEDCDDRTLIFLDPPYVRSKSYYGRSFSAEDHERLSVLHVSRQHGTLHGTQTSRWVVESPQKCWISETPWPDQVRLGLRL
jgi:site-specific DNA-adenine methylase